MLSLEARTLPSFNREHAMCCRTPARLRLFCLGWLFLCPISLPAIVTSGLPDNYLTPFGAGWDGVTSLEIVQATRSVDCSGVLLGTGQHVLTAAHCLTDSTGMPNVFGLTARFETASIIEQIDYASILVYAGYTGDVFNGNDLAIVTLASPAPAGANRYSIYRGSDETGQIGVVAGYGATGQGHEDDSLPAGQRRIGLNRLDADGSAFQFAGADSLLLYDFDNGLPQNDGLGVVLGLHDLGEGLQEVFPSHGDSGGPTFLNGAVAGLHSFSFRENGPDVDDALNQSFGEFAADVRVSAFAGWIDSQVAVPEPASGILILPALAFIMLRRLRK